MSKNKKEKVEKVSICIRKSLLATIDKMKQAPGWRDNRSFVIESLIEEGLKNYQVVKNA